jgi:hypothetical protein
MLALSLGHVPWGRGDQAMKTNGFDPIRFSPRLGQFLKGVKGKLGFVQAGFLGLKESAKGLLAKTLED